LELLEGEKDQERGQALGRAFRPNEKPGQAALWQQ